MSYASTLALDLSPVRLSYAASLRGVKPRMPDESYSYAQVGAFTPLNFLAMAASNPKGTFYAYINHEPLFQQAKETAEKRQVTNANFILSLDELPKDLDYICFENLDVKATADDEIITLAKDHLAPNGILCYRYRAYNNMDECLRFLVEAYTPELSDQQSIEFLSELKTLGRTYFQRNLVAQNALNKAISDNNPSSFFADCTPNSEELMTSGTYEVMRGLLQGGFSFAGSADVSANYIQMAAPAETHDELEKCQSHVLYEVIKDFTVNQTMRSDIWIKNPVIQSEDVAELFGFFTYGITTPKEQIPQTMQMIGGDISLQSPVFTRLIDLLSTLPATIGDFLAHPSGQGIDPAEVISAIQVLVACGLAQPMRQHFEGAPQPDLENIQWTVPYNSFVANIEINTPVVELASPVAGSPLSLPAKEALVLQAIHKVGMEKSAGILQPELKRLIEQNPAIAANIIDTTDPNDEVVHRVLSTTITQNMLRWYAYGLLSA